MHENLADNDFRDIPVSNLRTSAGWKEVEINENGENLVNLASLGTNRIHISPQYVFQNIPHALSEMYLRRGAANRLLEASRFLPSGYRFVVWDAWRPLEVQQSLFDEFKARLRANFPEWNDEKLTIETQIYVSLPSTNPSRPSPHNTGGAIDLSICDLENNPIPMGVPFDFFGKEAGTDFYEKLEDINSEQVVFRNNRRLLYNLMTKIGFTNYDEEYWHFDYGNQFDAIRKRSKAIYGGALPNIDLDLQKDR